MVKENENSCKLECGANTGMNTETDIKKQTEEPKAQTMPYFSERNRFFFNSI